MESNVYLEKESIEEGGFESNLEALLHMFLLKNQDVEAAAIITTEGLPIIYQSKRRILNTFKAWD